MALRFELAGIEPMDVEVRHDNCVIALRSSGSFTRPFSLTCAAKASPTCGERGRRAVCRPSNDDGGPGLPGPPLVSSGMTRRVT